jgi:hypothetical protein
MDVGIEPTICPGSKPGVPNTLTPIHVILLAFRAWDHKIHMLNHRIFLPTKDCKNHSNKHHAYHRTLMVPAFGTIFLSFTHYLLAGPGGFEPLYSWLTTKPIAHVMVRPYESFF